MSLQAIEGIIYQVVQVEKAGAEFYCKLAASVPIEAAREVFQRLADDEVRHQKDFADLGATVQGRGLSLESAVNLVEVMSTAVQKVQAAMKGSELVNMDGVSLRQALDIGIQNEQEAIRVYSELLTIKNPEFNMIVKKIIEEEQKHFAILKNLKAHRLA